MLQRIKWHRQTSAGDVNILLNRMLTFIHPALIWLNGRSLSRVHNCRVQGFRSLFDDVASMIHRSPQCRYEFILTSPDQCLPGMSRFTSIQIMS